MIELPGGHGRPPIIDIPQKPRLSSPTDARIRIQHMERKARLIAAPAVPVAPLPSDASGGASFQLPVDGGAMLTARRSSELPPRLRGRARCMSEVASEHRTDGTASLCPALRLPFDRRRRRLNHAVARARAGTNTEREQSRPWCPASNSDGRAGWSWLRSSSRRPFAATMRHFPRDIGLVAGTSARSQSESWIGGRGGCTATLSVCFRQGRRAGWAAACFSIFVHL